MRRPFAVPSGVPPLAGAALLVCAAAAAQSPVFVSPAGERQRPGSELAVTWTLDPATREHDEMELVLSLDGGRTFPVRLTGRIAPGERSVEWRVPALPTERAVLALRAGDDEASDNEEILIASDVFAIDPPRAGEVEELHAVAGEWRTREALEGAPVRPLPRGIEPQGRHGEFARGNLNPDDLEIPPATDAPWPSRDRGCRRLSGFEPLEPTAWSVTLRLSPPLRL